MNDDWIGLNYDVRRPSGAASLKRPRKVRGLAGFCTVAVWCGVVLLVFYAAGQRGAL